MTTPICSTSVSRRSVSRSEEHTSELQSQSNLVCRLLLEKKKSSTFLGCPVCLLHKSARPDVSRPRRAALCTSPTTRLDTTVPQVLPRSLSVFFLIKGAPPEISLLPPPAPFPF